MAKNGLDASLNWVGLAQRAERARTSLAEMRMDPFEIQVYDATANPPGVPGLELHLNHVASGLRDAAAPELPQHRVTHATLEPSLGVRPWLELGGYFQTALRRDGTFDYAGVKLRSKFVTPPAWDAHFRLGLNLEVSRLPARYDRDQWAGELRPIVAWSSRRFVFAVNPILDQSLAGDGASDGPTFQPAAMALYAIESTLAVGFEYYANLGPIGAGLVPRRRQEHYLYEVVNVLSIAHVEINAGVGEGLTPASNDLVVKMIVGYVWDPPHR